MVPLVVNGIFVPVTYQRFSVYGSSGFLPAALLLSGFIGMHGRLTTQGHDHT